MDVPSSSTSPQLIVALRHGFELISASSSSSSLEQQQEQEVIDQSPGGVSPVALLILASQSPRRREILDMMGLAGRFRVQPSPLDEAAWQARLRPGRTIGDSSPPVPDELLHPVSYTRILAEEKAKALAMQLLEQPADPTTSTKTILVLGSDTIVDWQDHILEKPTDAAEARVMLTALSGQQHMVHTGVALFRVLPIQSEQQRPTDHHHDDDDDMKHRVQLVSSFTDTAVVQFADLSEADIAAYVATGEPLDKAGAYGIQGIGGQLVRYVQGDFFTVMGLPMHATSRMLAQAVQDLLGQNDSS